MDAKKQNLALETSNKQNNSLQSMYTCMSNALGMLHYWNRRKHTDCQHFTANDK